MPTGRWVRLAGLVLALGFVTQAAQADDPPQATASPRYAGSAPAFDTMRKSMVRIFARSNGYVVPVGSGVVIGRSTDSGSDYLYIVTAYHVLQAIQRMGGTPAIAANGTNVAKTGDGVFATRIVGGSADIDLGFLETNQLKSDSVQVATTAPDGGEEVRSVGYPGAADQAVSGYESSAFIRPGQVSSVEQQTLGNGSEPPFNVILHSAPIAPGDSGGGLFDDCGGLVGINRSDSGHYSAAGVDIPAQSGIYVAVAAGEAVRLAHQLGINVSTVGGSCKPGSAPTDAAAPAGTAPMAATPPPGPPDGADASRPSGGARPVLLFALGIAFIALVAGAAAVVFLRRSSGEAPEPFTPLPAPHDPALAAPQTLLLDGVDGSDSPIRFSISSVEAATGGGVVIGRAPSEGGRTLPDERARPLVSREHIRIGYRDGGFTVQDNNSSNGTLIAGERLAPGTTRPLDSGVRLRLADRDFSVQIQ